MEDMIQKRSIFVGRNTVKFEYRSLQCHEVASMGYEGSESGPSDSEVPIPISKTDDSPHGDHFPNDLFTCRTAGFNPRERIDADQPP